MIEVFYDPIISEPHLKDFSVVYTVGNFDGLHKGHKKLLEDVVIHAKKNNQKAGVITFIKHPRLGKNVVGHLSSKEEKEAYFKSVGFDFVLFLDFDKIKGIEFDKFIYYLYDNFQLRTLISGEDNKIGKDGCGVVEVLKEKLGNIIEIIEVNFVKNDGEKVSSSLLRELVLNGEMSGVRDLLSENYKMMSFQERGKGIGREIGAPTLNLKPFDKHKIIPKNGVYAVKVFNEDKIYVGACNIGYRPTFDDGEGLTIEIHVIGEYEELDSNKFIIEFIEYIREEKRFNSVEELKFSIKNDIEKIRRITGGNINECY